MVQFLFKNFCVVLVVLFSFWRITQGASIANENGSFMDSLSTGFKFASKLLGMNQSSNVASLVAQAFGEGEKSSSASTHQITPPPQSQNYQYEDASYSSNEKDNLVVSSDKADNFSPTGSAFQDGVTSTTTTTTTPSSPLPGMNGLVGGLLRVLGMDEGKMSALLINGMIFMAQMVKNGASFVDRQLQPLKHIFQRLLVRFPENSVIIAKT